MLRGISPEKIALSGRVARHVPVTAKNVIKAPCYRGGMSRRWTMHALVPPVLRKWDVPRVSRKGRETCRHVPVGIPARALFSAPIIAGHLLVSIILMMDGRRFFKKNKKSVSSQ